MTLAVEPMQSRGGLVSLARLGRAVLALSVFLGGFVVFEPAPYELFLVAVIPLWFLGGLKIPSSVGPLFVLLIVYMCGGLLSTTQTGAPRFVDALVYMGVSLFLSLSAVWYAALISEDVTRVRLVERAYMAAALVSALVGITSYFHLLPDSDLFLLYDRARGTFQDPNVFGPYLLLPTLVLARRLMTRPVLTQPGNLLLLAILTLALFLSFSRGAWGMTALALIILAMTVAATARTNRQRLVLVGMVVAGLVFIVVLLGIAASIPSVHDMLLQRAKLVQDYDGKTGAELGRFARHWVGFMMATERPLGIGPWEFDRLFIEATHNTYLKALMEYGWLGFAAYVTLIIWTARKAGRMMLQRNDSCIDFSQCVAAAFFAHVAVGWIIDTDHWRHFYMIVGLIWGLESQKKARLKGPGQLQDQRKQVRAVSPVFRAE
ncbi:O-antigen ligase family protein [Oryzibacter oryziterrae]|uniref:O-antigen ligase family protein n=1 Tax=Oryzibacter oryziterrae TaxID=2766474 RepID=UPI001F29A184|nr:O-antigen ligase family protein [Oryzibacter oryziterrae]